MRRASKRSVTLLCKRSSSSTVVARISNNTKIISRNHSLYRSTSRALSKKISSSQTSWINYPFQTPLLRSSSISFNSVRAFADYPNHEVLELPALSPTMEHGGLLSWAVKEGDKVAEGDVLAEVETDKTNINWTTTSPGFIAKIMVAAGTKELPLGAPCAILVRKKEDIAKFKDYVSPAKKGAAAAAPAPAPAAPAPKKEEPAKKAAAPEAPAAQAAAPEAPKQQAAAPQEPPKREGRIAASPLAKKTAAEKGIDLAYLSGTGPSGRIIQADVLEYKAVERPPPAAAAQAAERPVAAAPTLRAPTPPPAGAKYTDIPASQMRKIIASRLTESKQTIPHYYLTVECEVEKLLSVRQELNKLGDGKFKLSLNDFIVKAAALALKQVPEVNSSWGGDFVRRYEDVDICVAVQTPDGLFTPIVPEADKQGVAAISAKVKDLAAKAKEKRLAPEEYQGGTFTISNLGMFGIKEFAAVINPPQSSILAVGATEKKVVVDESKGSAENPQFKVVNVVTVTLSCDHRVVDGAVGARWLAAFKDIVEEPIRLLL